MDEELDKAVEGMSPPVASLMREMMTTRPGLSEVKALRDRIIELHHSISIERDRLALIFAFWSLREGVLVRVDEETARQLSPIMWSDYLMMLNVEAMEGELINPRRLAEITTREVDAGRLEPNDEFHLLAVAGGEVIGPTHDRLYSPRKSLFGWLTKKWRW